MLEALYDLGLRALYPEHGFSKTHPVLVDAREIGSRAATELQKANIIRRDTHNDSGLRMGTQESASKKRRVMTWVSVEVIKVLRNEPIDLLKRETLKGK